MSPQGKRSRPQRPRPAAQPTSGRSSAAKRIGIVAFAALLIALFVIVAVAQGIGDPSVPSDAIAVVDEAPNGTITKDDFNRALVQTAARQGLKEVPKTTDPQYQTLADAAESDLLLSRWVAGEAQERGIETTDREIDDELDKVKQQQFGGSEQQFQKFLDQSGFTDEEARQRIELQLISDRIQTDVLPQNPSVSDDEIQQFYDANISQFEQPESRDVRVILTKEQADAQAALAALQKDDSDKSFQEVAKKYSVDEATKSTGGLRQGVVQGQSEPTLDDQIFSAQPEHAGRSVQGRRGLLRDRGAEGDPGGDLVARRRAPADQPDARGPAPAGDRPELPGRLPDQVGPRTFCADGFRIDRCANAEPPPPTCTEQLIKTTGCDAPVPPRGVFDPGTQGVFGSPPPTIRPQGPVRPASAAASQGQLPPGLVPGGAVPPGSVPPGSVPPGTVPPQGSVPPGTAPQTAPPPGG